MAGGSIFDRLKIGILNRDIREEEEKKKKEEAQKQAAAWAQEQKQKQAAQAGTAQAGTEKAGSARKIGGAWKSLQSKTEGTAATARTAAAAAAVSESRTPAQQKKESMADRLLKTRLPLNQNAKTAMNQAENTVRGSMNYQDAQTRKKLDTPLGEGKTGGWLQATPKEVRRDLGWKTAQQRTEEEQKARREGVYNPTGNIAMKNAYGRQEDRQAAYGRIEAAEWENDALRKRMESAEVQEWTPDASRLVDISLDVQNEQRILDTWDPETAEWQNAQKEMSRLRLDKGFDAQVFSTTTYNEMRKNGATQAEMRKAAYDSINYDGAYEQAVLGMKDEERKQFNSQLDEVLNGFRNEEEELQNKITANNLKIKNDRALIEQADYWDEQEKMLDQLYRDASGLELDTTFRSGLDVETPKYGDYFDRGHTSQYDTSNIDNIYSFLGGGNEFARAGYLDDSTQITKEYRGTALMTEQERNHFIGLYNLAADEGREPTEAKAFLDALQPFLNERYRPYEELSTRATAAQLPVLSSVGSLIMEQTKPLMAGAAAIGRLAGDPAAKDVNSWYYGGTRAENDIRSEVSNQIGGVGGKAYLSIMNGLDNALRAGILRGTGLTGKMLEAGTLAEFAGSAYMTAYESKMRETHNDDLSLAYALVDAGIETATELLPIDAMLGDAGNFLQYFLKNAASEMGEEFAGGVAGDYIHAMIDGTRAWEDRAAEIYKAGGYEDGNGNWVKVGENNIREAYRQAFREKGQETLEAMLSAGFTTVGSSTYAVGQRVAENFQIGKQVERGSADVNEMTRSEKQQNTMKNIQSILEAAKQMKVGTKSRELAEKLWEPFKNGTKPRAAQVGELVRDIAGESSTEIAGIVKDVAGEAIKQDLVKNGMDVYTAADVKNTVVKLIVGEEVSNREMKAIAKSTAAQNVIRDWRMSTPEEGKFAAAQAEIRAKTEGVRSVRDTAADLLTTAEDIAERDRRVKEMTGSAVTATDTEIRNAEGVRSGSLHEAVVEGKFADIVGVKDGKVVVRENGEERTVGFEDVRAVNGNVAKVLAFAQADGGSLGSERLTASLLKHGNVENPEAMISEALKVRMAGVLGKSVPRTQLKAEVAQEIYEGAKADFRDAEAQRVKNAREIRPGEGKTTFQGAEFGTKEWKQNLKGLSWQQRGEASAIANIAKAGGFNVTIINDKENMDVYGSEGNTGIVINLAGEEAGGKHHHALVTFGHEITHFLEANSAQAYGDLRNYALNMLETQGMDIDARIRQKIDLYRQHGQQLDVFGAISEIVADGCDQILGNRSAIRHLQETDGKLYSKVKNAVLDMVDRIKAGMEGSASREGGLLLKHTNELVKLWTGAYDEAITRKIGETGTGTGKTQLSVRDNTEYRQAVEKGNWKAAETVLMDDIRTQGERSGNTAMEVNEADHSVTLWARDAKVPETGTKYSVRDRDIAVDYLQKNAQTQMRTLEDERQEILGKYGIKENRQAGSGLRETADYSELVSRKDARRLQEITRETAVWQDRYEMYGTLEEDDPGIRYIDAWRRFDTAELERILGEKIDSTPGVIPYKKAVWYSPGKHQQIANLIKEGNPEAIMIASAQMAEQVPENAVLVPMPNHHGVVDDSTDTMLLAQAISKLTGRPVVNALAGVERKSRKESKLTDEKAQQVTAADMGFRQTAEIPEGTIPYFIDNLVASGVTAQAAHDAFGRGVTLAYAKSTRTAQPGLKEAGATFYDKEQTRLIPLDERIDMGRTGPGGVKHSVREMDSAYDEAVKKDDKDAAQYYVNMAAEKAGYDVENVAYHGTKMFGFTKFNLEAGRNTIFVSYNIPLAASYTRVDPEIRQISDRNGVPQNQYVMNDSDLIELSKKALKNVMGGELISIKRREDGLLSSVNDKFEVKYKDPWSGKEETTNYRRHELFDAIDNWQNPNGEYDGIYELYTRPGNQLVVDAEGKNWDEIEFDLYGWEERGDDWQGYRWVPTDWSWDEDFEYDQEHETTANPRQIAKWAKAHGYDSVRINNIHDNGGRNAQIDYEDSLGDIGIFFNPEDVKSADTVTYDDNGKVIPPSERFNTKEEDIRWSIRELPTGEKYVNIDIDQEQFKGLKPKDILKKSQQIIKDRFAGKVIRYNGGKARVDAKTAGEYAYSSKRNLPEAVKRAKGKASTELDNLVKVGNLLKPGDPDYPNQSNHKLGANTIGYKYYKTNFVVNGRWFTGIVNIEQKKGYNRIKDITSIKEDASRNVVVANNSTAANQAVGAASAGTNITQNTANSNTKKSLRDVTDAEYRKAVENGDEETALRMVDEQAGKNGYRIRAYHGTGRADRVGTVFLPERATSGPMAFFTDNREIAENYSRNKVDTSIAYDEEYGDYRTQFRTRINGKSVPVGDLWKTLSYAEKRAITEKAKHITLDDEAEEIIYDENAKHGVGNFTDYELRRNGGNSIETLIEGWLTDGTLYGREEEFLKVLELAGIKNVTWNNPDAREEKVYDTYLKIDNPFDVNSMYTEEFLNDLEAWWKTQDRSRYEKESMGADYWDKNNISVEDWIRNGRDDIKNGVTHNWTRIPDGVSAYLKEQGYDGIKDRGGKNGGRAHTVWIPFTSEQIKERSAAEYDDDGNLIPLSERFNPEKRDIRWSIRDETAVDVDQWMRSVNENSLQTEAEKQLLRDYKDLRFKVDLQVKKETDIKNRIKEIEVTPEENRTDEQKKMLKNLKIRLENAEKVREEALEKLKKITDTDGYANLMYRQRKTLENFIYGRTQAEVRDAVEGMEKSAAAVQKRIEENLQKIAEIRNDAGLSRVRQMLGTTTVDQVAGDLKKEFHSTWTKGEIRNWLDPLLLKMARGEDISGDVEDLAGELIRSDARNVEMDEDLAALKGLTIVIGPGQQAELKAQGSSLAEVRRRLAGTGIKVRYGDRSTLEGDISDLIEEYGEGIFGDLGDEKDALENFLQKVENRMAETVGGEGYQERLVGAMTTVMKKAASAASGIYIPTEAKARDQVLGLIEYIKSLSARTEKAERALLGVAEDMANLQKSGRQASGMANVLQRDVNIAIDYYNKTAQMAEDTARKRRLNEQIEQLKSEHAQKILKNNEEWRNLIERDRQAREKAQDNERKKSAIYTDIKRLYNLLSSPKPTQNIPEHMRGLARELVQTFVDNDLNNSRRKLTKANRQQLKEARRKLIAWEEQDGPFDIADMNAAEDAILMIVNSDLLTIYNAIEAYNGDFRKMTNLERANKRGEILKEMKEALGELYTFIQNERNISTRDRQILTEDAAYMVQQGTGGKKYREFTGRGGRAAASIHKALVSGNLTPEYFFRMLDNEGLTMLWDEGYHDAEDRNGKLLRKAQARLEQIAKEYGFSKWDTKQKVKLQLKSGETEVTLGQLMTLWATWKREQQQGPAMSQHLTKGGFYAEQDLRDGNLLGRTVLEKKAHRVTPEDMVKVRSMLTKEQRDFVDAVVGYMSNDMSELGNEASLKAYGIKLYKEKYYFPFQIWNGVKSRKSNDSGRGASAEQAFHPSFSNSRVHGANNALILGDFMETAADHIVGMINYATMGLADVNLQKVLNHQVTENQGTGNETKRNVRAIIEETYGQEAMQYLAELQKQLNGGAVRTTKSLGDKAISLFRKNAVAGSLSVAAQQPLSYIRAAVMINPKYLAEALNPKLWKGSYQEMMDHSGVAVIKDMGRFDMNAGQSAREYLMPDRLESKGRKAWNWVTDKATVLPELADRAMWTRMWSAVKAEQADLNPDMDVNSEEFLNKVGERFNDLMRRTQVYDSVLVKSQNMRSDNYWVKGITSFMAEPTLTLNVLADAVRQAARGEKGGKGLLAKAGATFLLSAALQAAIKALFSTGRTPDDKKTWWENFQYRFGTNLISEANPATMVPGYSDLVTILKDGKLNDDAMGAIGKMFSAFKTGRDTVKGLVTGESTDWYRGIEDSAAQIAQLFTNLPAKNLMREVRAMYNWFIAQPYAARETNAGVLKYQLKDAAANADNLTMALFNLLTDAGYETKNAAYYERIWNAKKAGNEQEAQDMIDYLIHGKGVKPESVSSGVATAAKKDGSASVSDRAEFLAEEGKDAGGWILEQFRKGEITEEEALKELQKADPEADADSLWWKVDRAKWKLETGETVSGGTYYRLKAAIEDGKSDGIRSAVKQLLEHGYNEKKIRDWISRKDTGFKDAYLQATGTEKVRIKNALILALKAAGMSEADANAAINKWK